MNKINFYNTKIKKEIFFSNEEEIKLIFDGLKENAGIESIELGFFSPFFSLILFQKKIDGSSCYLSKKGAEIAFDKLKFNKTLKKMNLTSFEMSAVAMNSICDALNFNEKLRILCFCLFISFFKKKFFFFYYYVR